MKVIDILQRIANEEEALLIKYKDKILHWNKEKDRFEDKDGMNTLYEIDFSELNDEIEVIEEQKEETKTTTRESIEALGYACGEIQKCFTNGWEKSLKSKSLNEEDKKIKRLPYYDYKETMSENNRDKFIEKLLEKRDKRLNDYHEKINEIIDYINGGTNGE